MSWTTLEKDKHIVEYTGPKGKSYYAYFRIKGRKAPVKKKLNAKNITDARAQIHGVIAEETERFQRSNPDIRDIKTLGGAGDIYLLRTRIKIKIGWGGRKGRVGGLCRARREWNECFPDRDFDQTPLLRVTPDDIRNWAFHCHRKFSSDTYNSLVDVFHNLILIGVEAGTIKKDIMKENGALIVDREDRKKHEITLPSRANWVEMVNEAKRMATSPNTIGASWLMQFLAYTGCRIQEARGFKRHEIIFAEKFGGVHPEQIHGVRKRDVDMVHRQITVWGKGKRGQPQKRSIPMVPELYDLCQEIFTARPDMADDDKLMTVNGCANTLTHCCKLVGIPRLTQHKLRHLFCTRMAQIVMPFGLMELLGHSSLQMTRIYYHPEGDRELVGKHRFNELGTEQNLQLECVQATERE